MHQRQKKILDMLQKGKLLIPETADILGVSQMTLRRDLRELEKRKLLLQVKNGAIPHPARYEPEPAAEEPAAPATEPEKPALDPTRTLKDIENELKNLSRQRKNGEISEKEFQKACADLEAEVRARYGE